MCLRMPNYVLTRIFKLLISIYIYLRMLNLNKNSLSNAMKILIVDDNFLMRGMTRNFLQDLADEIRECEDGSEALSAFEKFLPDLVLMDWEMKKMDGIAATKEIMQAFPKAKVLMFTQYDDAELRIAAVEAGVCGFILKDDLQSLRLILSKENKSN